MPWTRIDDQAHSHPKIQQAWHTHRASLGLHLLALSHANCYTTDGFISETFVKTQIPSQTERRKTIGALVDAGLWNPDGRGWRIHNFLKYNDSKAKILAKRAADSKRKRNGFQVEA